MKEKKCSGALSVKPVQMILQIYKEENPPELLKGGFSGITLAYNAKSENEVDEILQSHQ